MPAWEREGGHDQENFPKESVLTKAGAQYTFGEGKKETERVSWGLPGARTVSL